MRAAISGWGTALPEQRLTNADLERRVDTSDEWIVERTGIRERRVAGEGETTASLAIEAGAAAIKHAGLTPDAIDLLIVATATPEQPIPHTGAFVGDGLGLRCGSFDLNAGCAGLRLRARRRRRRCSPPATSTTCSSSAAETLSRVVDPTDRGTCILFGDGAAAMVLSAAPRRRPRAPRLGPRLRRLRHRAARDPGRRQPPAPRPPRPSPTGEHYLKMAGQEVFRRAVRIVVDSATAALATGAASRVDDVAWFVAAPGQRPHHRGRRQPARDPGGAHPREHRPLRQHRRRVDPARARRSRRRRPPRATATSCSSPASAPA